MNLKVAALMAFGLLMWQPAFGQPNNDKKPAAQTQQASQDGRVAKKLTKTAMKVAVVGGLVLASFGAGAVCVMLPFTKKRMWW